MRSGTVAGLLITVVHALKVVRAVCRAIELQSLDPFSMKRPLSLVGDARFAAVGLWAKRTLVIGLVSMGATALAAPAGTPFAFGSVVLHPNVSYYFSSSDGLQSAPGKQAKTELQTATAGLLADLGKRWSSSYAATWSHYSSSAFHDAVDHSASLSGSDTFGDWSVSLAVSYGSSSAPLAETGRQTNSDAFSASVSGSRHFSPNLSFNIGAGRSFRLADQFNTGRDISLNARVQYLFSQQVDASLGTSAAFITKGNDPNQIALHPSAEVGWRPSSKISMSASVGAERNQFQGPSGKSFDSPTYGLSISYRPLSASSVSAGATRAIGRSYFNNQVSETTSWSVGLNQRLLQILNLRATMNHSEVSYLSTTTITNIPAGRNDGINSMDFSLSTNFLRRGSVAITYGRSRDSSNRTGFSFSSSQMGIRTTFSY